MECFIYVIPIFFYETCTLNIKIFYQLYLVILVIPIKLNARSYYCFRIVLTKIGQGILRMDFLFTNRIHV